MRQHFFILLGSLFLLSHCTKNAPKEAPKEQKTLTVLSPTLPSAPNWHWCESRDCYQWIGLVMDGLTKIDVQGSSARVLPALAKRWTQESPVQMTFELRENIQWTDGTPFTTRDVVRGWKKLLLSRSPHKKLLYPIKGATLFSAKKIPFSKLGIYRLDDFRLRVSFEHPVPEFPRILAHPATWPVGKGIETTLGPYRLAARTSESWTLEPFAGSYHKPTLAKITIKKVASAKERVESFVQGRAQLASAIPLNLRRLLPKPNHLTHRATAEVVGLAFNTRVPPFHSSKVRRALSQLIDKNEILKIHELPHQIAESPQWSLPIEPDDPPPASELIRTLKKSSHWKKLKLKVFAPEELSHVAENIRAQWQRHLQKPVVLSKSLSESPVRLIQLPVSSFRALSGLEDFSRFGLVGFANFRHGLFERYLNKARGSWNLATRDEQLVRALEFVTQKSRVFTPLYFESESTLVAPGLSGLGWSPELGWSLKNVSLSVAFPRHDL